MKKIQLSIPEPCQQHWDDMTVIQQGRFCNACTKEVIDFGQMSDTELLNYFNMVKNKTVCGRAYPDQLNRTITAVSVKKWRWYWNYIVACLLFFSRSSTVKAQGMVMVTKASHSKPVKSPDRINRLPMPVANGGFTIQGSIESENGHAVPFASIRLLHSNNGVRAGEDGKFVLKIDSLHCMIEISSLNYETQQLEINDLQEKKIVLKTTNQLMKEVVITSIATTSFKGRMGAVVVRCSVEKRNIIKDTIQNWVSSFNPVVKIYPNPVLKGHAFNVDLTLKRTGSYTIQIINAAGNMLLERKINTATKKLTEQLRSSNTWGAGFYYLRVMNDKGKLIATANIEVQ